MRKALRSSIAGPKAALKGGPNVTLHVETYGIAVSAVDMTLIMTPTETESVFSDVNGYATIYFTDRE